MTIRRELMSASTVSTAPLVLVLIAAVLAGVAVTATAMEIFAVDPMRAEIDRQSADFQDLQNAVDRQKAEYVTLKSDYRTFEGSMDKYCANQWVPADGVLRMRDMTDTFSIIGCDDTKLTLVAGPVVDVHLAWDGTQHCLRILNGSR